MKNASIVSELDALLRLERKARTALQWQWEDTHTDQVCRDDMEALRASLDDLDAIRRVLADSTVSDRKSAAQVIGSIGGKARAAVLSPEERSTIAKQGAAARWKKD